MTNARQRDFRIAPHVQGKRVLIVEDDQGVLELVQTRLELAGIRTFISRNGVEGVKRAAELRPDAIVLDINMPLLSGFSVLAELRQSETLCAIPVLMLTSRNHMEDVRRAIALGARNYLSKPFNDQQLVQRINRLLRPVRDRQPTSAISAAVLL